MVDDALVLGVRQAAVNVLVGSLIDPSTHQVRAEALEAYAPVIEPLHRAGSKVYVILLNGVTGNPSLDRFLLHPKFSPKAPNRLSAFNVVDPAAVQALGAACSAMQARYKSEIDGWIVGNEINSHWEWANQGPASLDEVADTTERSLRIVSEATHMPVYLSLEHHWTIRSSSSDHSVPGRDLLEQVAKLAKQRGDFGWRVAFHPYPQNLFEPRFWNDDQAQLRFDTPKITFKNIEVLTEYLKQPRLRWKGKPRVVNLSEQGFHRPAGAEGEEIQAAAYAYAYERVARNPGIEAFILNRHVDNTGEGGLLLGLWTNKPGSVGDPDRKTRMWEVFRACGTADQAKTTEFALKLIGLKSWSEADPKPVER